MRYAVLIYGPEAAREQRSEEDFAQEMKLWGTYTQDLIDRKAMLGGEALQPTSTATTIRLDRKGDVVTTDGPFAETKEALGGFYLIEAADLDTAIDLARGLPNLRGGGSAEIRPIMEVGDMTQA